MKRVCLKYWDCCIYYFNRAVQRLIDEAFEFYASDLLEVDTKRGYIIYNRNRLGSSDHNPGDHVDGMWWEVVTESDIEEIKKGERVLPYFCDKCKEDSKRLREGLLSLSRQP